MPTVLRVGGFRFEIIPGDHEPPHVHVYYGGDEAKLTIASGELRADTAMKGKDLAMAKLLLKRHRESIQVRWESINGRR